jgi:Tfp pilus assembly protein PilV
MMVQSHFFTAMRKPRRSVQRGFALLEVGVAALVLSVIVGYALQRNAQTVDDTLAETTATYLGVIATGAQRLTLTNFNEYANNTPIAGVANALRPTLDELKTAGLIQSGLRSLTPTNQTARIDVARTNCPGASCLLVATVCTTEPLMVRGKFRDDLATNAASSLKGSGARSMIGSGAIVRGATIQIANPNGNVEGVVCAQNVVDTALFNRFLTLNDPRDINLLGSLTVGGSVGSGTGTDAAGVACRRSELTNTGQVNAKAGNCILRVNLNGNDGSISSMDATGATRAGIRYNAITGQSEVFGDSLLNNAGTAGIRSDGTVFGNTGQFNTLVINNTAAAGGFCSPANSVVFGTAGGKPVLMKCTGGVWVNTGGTDEVVADSACAINGADAVTSAGVKVICVGNSWIKLSDRMGRQATYEIYEVRENDQVPSPPCATGGLAKIVLSPQSIDASKLYASYRAEPTAGGWVIRVRDGANAALAGVAIAATACWYP